LPFVDIRNLDPNFIANATMVRKMIYNNVGNKLDHLIRQTPIWNNTVYDQLIPLKNIDDNVLDISVKNRVNIRGLPIIIKNINNLLQEYRLYL